MTKEVGIIPLKSVEETMSQSNDDPVPGQVSLETAEARMRRALNFPPQASSGNHGAPSHSDHAPVRLDPRPGDLHSGSRPRSRFVQDGDVPVTIVSRQKGPLDVNISSNSRLATTEVALSNERSARTRIERSLHEAQAIIHDLRTKQGHAELALHEATQSAKLMTETLRSEYEAIQARLENELMAERTARLAAEAALRGATSVEVTAEIADPAPEPVRAKRGRPRLIKPAPSSDELPARTARKRVAVRKAAEPKPVKWWR